MAVAIEEQEFVINHMRGEQMAEMYVSDSLYIRRMDKLVEISPEYYECTKAWKMGEDIVGKEYRFPVKLLAFRKAPIQSNMSEEHKEASIRRMKMWRDLTDEEKAMMKAVKTLLEPSIEKEEYSLYGEKEDAVCLYKENNIWTVFEMEQDEKIDGKEYTTIQEAVADMLNRLFPGETAEYMVRLEEIEKKQEKKGDAASD